MAKGRFIPINPAKYVGNPNNIFFRSSWELTVLKFFDKSNAVIRYASEEIVVPYVSPKDGKVHRYFPDFYVELINAQQVIEKWLVEVKPLKETDHQFAKTVYDKMAVAINEAKWNAAKKFCSMNGLQFKVITELDIYKMDPTKKNKMLNRTNSTKKSINSKKTKPSTKVRSIKK